MQLHQPSTRGSAIYSQAQVKGSSVFKHHATHAIAWGPAVQEHIPRGPGTRSLRNTFFYRWEMRTGIFLAGAKSGRYWITNKLEDKQYCYRYVRCFISILPCSWRIRSCSRKPISSCLPFVRFGTTCSGTVSNSVRM